MAHHPTELVAEHRGNEIGSPVVRPFLLAGGLALIWFVQFQEARVEGDAPAWAFAIVLAVRLAVDFIGAWVALSAIRLIIALGRLGLIHLRAHWQQGSR
jgi:hypothetical protein